MALNTLDVTRGPVEKMSFFQIVHMTKVSTQIHSSLSQYDVYKVLSKRNDHRVTQPLVASIIETLHANKMPRFTCYYEPMLKLPNYMHMGHKKYGHCPNVWVEDACKVLGPGFNV